MDVEQKTTIFSKYLWYWVWCAWLILGIIFELLDTRELADFGNYYRSLPDWIAWYRHSEGHLGLWDLLRPMGGWYVGFVAVLHEWGIPLRVIFVMMGAWWLGILCWSLRHVSQWTLILLMGMPIWIVSWHSNWLHLIETSLFCALWQMPMTFEKENTQENHSVTRRFVLINLVVLVLGFLLLALRPSALIWLGLLLLEWIDSKKNPVWVWSLLLSMGLGLLWLWPILATYVQGKLHVSPIQLSILTELHRHAFTWVLWGAGLGMLLLLKSWKRRYWFWMAAWLLMLALSWFFGVGLDNFLIGYLAMVILGGEGWQLRWSFEKWGAWGFAFSIGSLFASVLPPSIGQYVFLWTNEDIAISHPYNFLRPLPNALQLQEIIKPIHTICQSQTSEKCLIMTNHPLFHPHREAETHLSLISAGLENWEVRNAQLLWMGRQKWALPKKLQGVILHDCFEYSKNQSTSADPFLKNAQDFEKWVTTQISPSTTIENMDLEKIAQPKLSFIETVQHQDCSLQFFTWNSQ